jgi:UDP-2,3-diacylglucosamine hydrolase
MTHTLFISDLHLDAARPAITELFLSFLRTAAPQAQALYILGDLFEAWIGDDDPAPEHQTVIAALHELNAQGVALYFMHGNRDFLIGADFAAHSGSTLLTDPTLIDLYGTPTLLMHGDTLCTDDIDYQKFRRMVRDPHWQRDFLAKSLAVRRQMAQAARVESAAHTAGTAYEIMDASHDAVMDTLRTYQVTQLIHGHTHRPAMHDFELDGAPARRIVLGDWYEQGSVLRCDADGCRLESLPL